MGPCLAKTSRSCRDTLKTICHDEAPTYLIISAEATQRLQIPGILANSESWSTVTFEDLDDAGRVSLPDDLALTSLLATSCCLTAHTLRQRQYQSVVGAMTLQMRLDLGVGVWSIGPLHRMTG